MTLAPISAGSFFGRTMSVFIRTLPAFFFVSVLILSPLSVIDYRDVSKPPEEASFDAKTLVETMAQVALNYVLTGTLVYAVFRKLAGERMDLGECLGVAFKKLLPIVALSFILGMMVMIGFIVFIVPALIVIAVFGIAVPVIVIEGGSIGDALKRSSELTRGYRWSVFGAHVLATAALCACAFLASAIMGVLQVQDPLIFTLCILALKAVIASMFAILPTVIYHDLRALKDGVGVEDLRRVFE